MLICCCSAGLVCFVEQKPFMTLLLEILTINLAWLMTDKKGFFSTVAHDHRNIGNTVLCPSIERSGHIVLPLSVCLSIPLSQIQPENITFPYYFYSISITRLIFSMKVCVVDTHLLVLRSRSSTKLISNMKVTFSKNGHLGELVFHKQSLLPVLT